MSLNGHTKHRPAGPGYLRVVPAAEWVRRLEQIPDLPLRGGLANVIDWDFFLHLKVGHPTLTSPAYANLCKWAEKTPAGAVPVPQLEQGLVQLGYLPADAARRSRGDVSRENWNPFAPFGDQPQGGRKWTGKVRAFPDAVLNQAEQMMKKGWTLQKISQAIGRSDTTARALVRMVARRAEAKKSPVEGQALTGQDTTNNDKDN